MQASLQLYSLQIYGTWFSNQSNHPKGEIYRKKSLKYELKNTSSVTQRKFKQHTLFTTTHVLLMSSYMLLESFIISILCYPFYNLYSLNKHLSQFRWLNWRCDPEPHARAFPGQDYLLFTIKVEQLRTMNVQMNQTIPTILYLQCVTAVLRIISGHSNPSCLLVFSRELSKVLMVTSS